MKITTAEKEYLSSLKILCVEDSKTTQMMYESILEDVVQEIIFADDGNDGYEKYSHDEIDIIISDYEMPNLNGIDMIEKIREFDTNVPIILVSAIEEVDVIVQALQLGVNNFAKKPIVPSEILDIVANASKILLANKYIVEQEKKKLEILKAKETYNSYQEDLGFSKELNILRNDFYYQMIMSPDITLVDFMYDPLDVMSGDAYSARIIDENTTFYLVVDGMGKGLSASLTAMIMTTFINHLIDKMIELNSFDLSILISESMQYIQPILLEEEALAIDYVVIDDNESTMYYSKFAMPVILMVSKEDEIHRLKSNNAPLSKWSDTFNVDSYDIANIKKFLIYSDGIVENITKTDGKTYADFIEEDFLHAFTREDMKTSFLEKIERQEDDLTFVLIHKLDFEKKTVIEKTFKSSLADIDNANEWYTALWDTFTDNTTTSNGANIVFTELFMNAYEHGNLGIDAFSKNKLLEDDIYFETLLEKEKECSKVINVRVEEAYSEKARYIITQITDEGVGFDTNILSEIFRNSATFNGRGVFVSRKNSLGIYYNDKGNHVLFLNKI